MGVHCSTLLPPLQLVSPAVAKGARRLVWSRTHCLSNCLTPLKLHTSHRLSLQHAAFQRVKSGQKYGPRRLEFEMVPRGLLGARGLLRAHAGSSSKGSRLFSSAEPGVEAKLEEYCAKVPAPLSIAEFTERGRYQFPFTIL